jgi:hypothetical protein
MTHVEKSYPQIKRNIARCHIVNRFFSSGAETRGNGIFGFQVLNSSQSNTLTIMTWLNLSAYRVKEKAPMPF